jgi:hypothetical protein
MTTNENFSLKEALLVLLFTPTFFFVAGTIGVLGMKHSDLSLTWALIGAFSYGMFSVVAWAIVLKKMVDLVLERGRP